MIWDLIPAPYRLAAKIGVVALVVLAVGWLWHSRSSLKRDVADLEQQRAELAAANEDAQKAMARLVTLREQDSAALARLQAEVQRVTASDRGARRRLAELGRTDDAVRDWMSRPLPPALGCVLADEGCGEAGGGGGAPAGGAAPAVPAAGPSGAPDARRPRRGVAWVADRGARVRRAAAHARRVARVGSVTLTAEVS